MSVPFGWARPVPIDPVELHRGISMKLGVLLLALFLIPTMFMGVSLFQWLLHLIR